MQTSYLRLLVYKMVLYGLDIQEFVHIVKELVEPTNSRKKK